MSAVPQQRPNLRHAAKRRDVPKPAVSRCSREPLLDHLVGTLLEKERHVEAERLGGLEIDH